MLHKKCEKLRKDLLAAGFDYVSSWNCNHTGPFTDRIKAFDTMIVPKGHKHSLILKDLEYVSMVFTHIIDQAVTKRNLTVRCDLSFYLIITQPYPPLTTQME